MACHPGKKAPGLTLARAAPLLPWHPLGHGQEQALFMFANKFQGGPHVEVFSGQGSNPVADWKVGAGVKKEFDKTVRSYVYAVDGGAQTRMQLPKSDKSMRECLLPRLCWARRTFLRTGRTPCTLSHPTPTALALTPVPFTVGLVQPYLVVQAFLPQGMPFNMEIR